MGTNNLSAWLSNRWLKSEEEKALTGAATCYDQHATLEKGCSTRVYNQTSLAYQGIELPIAALELEAAQIGFSTPCLRYFDDQIEDPLPPVESSNVWLGQYSPSK